MIHYLQIREKEAFCLVDRENNIILLSNIVGNWEDSLSTLIHSLLEKLELSTEYLILVEYNHASDESWRVAQLVYQEKEFLPPPWKKVPQADINRLLWYISSSEDIVMCPPFPDHALVSIIKSTITKQF